MQKFVQKSNEAMYLATPVILLTNLVHRVILNNADGSFCEEGCGIGSILTENWSEVRSHIKVKIHSARLSVLVVIPMRKIHAWHKSRKPFDN